MPPTSPPNPPNPPRRQDQGDDPFALYSVDDLAKALMRRCQCAMITIEQPDENRKMFYRCFVAGSPAELLGLAVIGSRHAQEVYAGLAKRAVDGPEDEDCDDWNGGRPR